ncbi:hypothetical protein ACRW1C_26770 [Escherichia coli]
MIERNWPDILRIAATIAAGAGTALTL